MGARQDDVLLDAAYTRVRQWSETRERHVSLQNGEVSDGEWKENMQHGHGTYLFKDGELYEGKWKNGIGDEYWRGKVAMSTLTARSMVTSYME